MEFQAKTLDTKYCSHACNSRDYKKRLKEAKSGKAEGKGRQTDLEQFQMKEFLTVIEASILLRTSKKTIYRMISDGKINSINLGERKTIIRRSDIEGLFRTETPEVTRCNQEREEDMKTYSLDEWIKTVGVPVDACYNLNEIQDVFGISETAVQQMIIKNRIPKLKLGWFAYVPKQTINKLLGKQ